jgi:hypothetical protein
VIKVTDTEGNPIAGAMVQVCKDSCLPGVTDANGVAKFAVAEDTGYKASFLSLPEGYVYVDETVTEWYFEDGATEITIQLKIAENGQLWQKLQMYMQMALQMAQQLDPMMAQTIAMDITKTLGGMPMAAPAGGAAPKLVQSNNVTGLQNKEHALVANARERAASTGMPGGSAANKEG